MRRLHAEALPPDGGAVELGGDAARHAKVLRLSAGATVVLFDGEGHEADATIDAIGERVRCTAGPRRDARPDRPRVVLCQALPKGGKLDDIVRATTELGVAAIHLAHGARSVARPDEGRADKKLGRLAKIAREAARQSERADVPEIVAPAPLDDVAARAPAEAAKIALVVGAAASLDEALPPEAPEVWLVIGPEGGLAEAEVEALRARGFAAAGLGSAVLRVQTAAPVAVALAMARLGGLRPPS